MTKILKDIKATLGVDENNLGFDTELLLFLNAVKAEAVQNGVVAFSDVEITVGTEWPEFPNEEIKNLVKGFMVLRTRLLFDPVASEPIAKSFESAVTVFEGRLIHEVEEAESNV